MNDSPNTEFERVASSANDDESHDKLALLRKDLQTPLSVTLNWDYRVYQDQIRRLYELGKKRNWNAGLDIDWSQTHARDLSPWTGAVGPHPLTGYAPYDALSEAGKIEFAWQEVANRLSQFLHGEQAALIVASQLASCAPTINAKLYAASQAFDEARHVEVFSKYLETKLGVVYPVHDYLDKLITKILRDERWDLKFIGMQIIIEGLALAAFHTMKKNAADRLLNSIVSLVIQDEARHVNFGVHYLREHVKQLSREELEERATFAYEACVVCKDHMISTHVFKRYGWDVEEAKSRVSKGGVLETFRNLLFMRIVPNLSRIGLLTERVRPLFADLGILQYEDMPGDDDIDWESEASLASG